MSTYTVTLRADKAAWPVLLSNGNLVAQGVAVANIVAASTSLRDFFTSRKEALLTKIRTKGALDAEIEAELKSGCDEWKSTFATK